jgi:hypothetical protein
VRYERQHRDRPHYGHISPEPDAGMAEPSLAPDEVDDRYQSKCMNDNGAKSHC